LISGRLSGPNPFRGSELNLQNQPEGNMPRSRSNASGLTREDLIYLAGFFESNQNIKGIATNNAVAISNSEAWPKYMAETFGGTHDQFQSSRGKTYWGWYVPLERRYELAKMLEKTDPRVTRATGPYDWDAIRGKLEKGLAGRMSAGLDSNQ
jgi:hypothetical protein